LGKGRAKPFPHEALPECKLPEHFHRSAQQKAQEQLQQCKARHFNILLKEEEIAGWLGPEGRPLLLTKKVNQLWGSLHGGTANAERRKLMERRDTDALPR